MPRPIKINPVLNGFIVEVGCQVVVFTSIDDMTKSLAAYYKDPEFIEQTYIKSAINKTMNSPLAVPERPQISRAQLCGESIGERVPEPPREASMKYSPSPLNR